MPKLNKEEKAILADFLHDLADIAARAESIAEHIGGRTATWRESFENRSAKWHDSEAGERYEEELCSIEAVAESLQQLNESTEALDAAVEQMGAD